MLLLFYGELVYREEYGMWHRLIVRLLLIFLFTLPTTSLLAGEELKKIVVYGKKIPHFLDHPTNSPFTRFLRKLEKISGIEFTIHLLPAKRATVLFEQGEADLLIPFPIVKKEAEAFSEFSSKPLASYPVAKLQRHILTLQSKPRIHSLREARGYKIGLTLGYEYAFDLLDFPGMTFDYSPDQVSLVKKLYSGRIDAIVSFPFEAALIAKKLGNGKPPHYESEFVLSYSDIVMLMHDNERGRKITKQLNLYIVEMEKSGELQELSQSFNQ